MSPRTDRRPWTRRPPGRPGFPAVALLAAAVLAPPATPADVAAQGRAIAVSGVPYGADIGVAWPVGGGLSAGLQLGLLPQLAVTLRPDQEAGAEPELSEYLHVAAFVRFRPTDRVDIDAGARAGIGDLWPCPSSDCLPVTLAGLYVQPMVGWPRFKVGPRLTAAWVGETRTSSAGRTFVLALHPVVVRWTFGR